MTTFGQGSMRGRLLLGQAGIPLCLFVLAVAGCDKFRGKPETSPAKRVNLLIG
ncbi:MAG: hypothetical protein ACSLE2_14270 [Lysobacterales bacterium]